MSKYHEPKEHDPHQDYFYNVTLVHDHFTVTTFVMASSDDDAIKAADNKLTMSEGLPEWIATEASERRAVVEARLA